MLSPHLRAPHEALTAWFADHNQVAVAYSGGVDSALLLYLGTQVLGQRCQGVFINSLLIAARQADFARAFAAKHHLRLVERFHEPLALPGFSDNSQERCYICKRAIYQELVSSLGGQWQVIDGTNLDDDTGSRPGFRAIAELAVATPYLHCQIDKHQIRQISKELGLATWDRPSDSCLATRIPHGQAISPEKLYTVEKVEDYLHELGFTGVRATPVGSALHLTCKEGDIDQLLLSEVRRNIQKKMADFSFSKVFLDLSERPGILP